MKKLFVLITILAIALVVCACSKPVQEVTAPTAEPTEEAVVTPEPTEIPEPTEAPEPTEEPAPTPMPTEAPVKLEPLPGGDYFAFVKENQPYIVDIDGDGMDDICLITMCSDFTADYYDAYMDVYIERACDPENPYEERLQYPEFGIYAVIADCDPSTPAKELIIGTDEGDFDFRTYVVRLKDDGSEFELFSKNIGFSAGSAAYWGQDDDWCFDASEGFEFCVGTYITGSHYVDNAYRITAEGFTLLSDEYTFEEEYDYWAELVRSLDIVTEDGSTLTVPAGTKFHAIGSDLETYVRIELEDGTTGTVEVSFGEDGYYPIYLNGVNQNEYAEFRYFG